MESLTSTGSVTKRLVWRKKRTPEIRPADRQRGDRGSCLVEKGTVVPFIFERRKERGGVAVGGKDRVSRHEIRCYQSRS